MVANAVLFSHTKEFEEAGQGYFCLVPKTKGRSEDYTWWKWFANYNELLVARDFFKKSKYACQYIQNEFPGKFRVLNHIWGDYFKWPK